MADILFDIEELADASGFEVSSLGYIASGNVTIAWTSTGGYDGNIILTDAEFNAGYTFEDSVGVFTDGVYTFIATSEADTGTRLEAFGAIITDRTVKELLSYRTYLTPAQKDWMLEKAQLLNNLRLSASVGATSQYQTNLEVLERMR